MPRSDEKKTNPAETLAAIPTGDVKEEETFDEPGSHQEKTDPGLEAVGPSSAEEGLEEVGVGEPSKARLSRGAATIEQMAWIPPTASDGATELLANPLSPELLAYLSAEEQAALLSRGSDAGTMTGEFDAAGVAESEPELHEQELLAETSQEWGESASPSTDPALVAVSEEASASPSTDPGLAGVPENEEAVLSVPGSEPTPIPTDVPGLPPAEQPFSQEELEASNEQSLVDEIAYKSHSDTFSDMPQFDEKAYKEALQGAEGAVRSSKATEREKPG